MTEINKYHTQHQLQATAPPISLYLPRADSAYPLQYMNAFLVGKQGKTPPLQIWNLKDIIASNAQLEVLNKKYRPEDVVFPDVTMKAGIAKKVVLLYTK